jgi:shikimate kinase
LKNIFLTGFMGCGKTSVGRILSARLGYEFVDLDEAIVNDAGVTIKEIFSSQGEPAFRELETRVLSALAARTGRVVSTGGGAVIAPQNRELMRKSGSIVNLTATVEAIVCRLTGDCDRPLLQNDPSLERVRSMLAAREEFYADADLRIDTTDKSVQAVADEIIDSLKGHL